MAEDELEKLKEKYNRLKQANKVLKEGLIEKNEACDRLETQLKEKDASMRQQLEEIDHLQFQNGRVSKQLGTVTAQLEEVKQRQQQGSGWSVGGLITGKQQQEAIKKAEEEVRALQDELHMKIEENEGLHMQLYESKREFELEQQRMQEESATSVADLDVRTRELAEMRQKNADLTRQVQELSAEIARLTDAAAATSALTNSLRSTLEADRIEASRQITELSSELARRVPFDEARHELWSAWDMGSARGREAQGRRQVISQLQLSMAEACKQSSNMLRIWTKTFGGGGDEESATRLRVRTKMSDMVERLASMIGERVPILLGSLDVLHLLPMATWATEFKAQSSTLLQTHRKWVMYQSMLLLHDWNSSYASRSEQEEAQAQRFVEWLWRLHRRVRVLFARLRVLGCIQGMQAANRSASHFALARRSARRKDSEGAGGRAEGGAASSRGAAAADGDGQALGAAPVADAAERLVESLRKGLRDVLQCWEGIGRCLSAWAMAQASPSDATPQEGGSVVELLEAVHRFSGCLADRVIPAMGRIISDDSGEVSRRAGDAPAQRLLLPAHRLRQGCSGYVARAGARLICALAAVGFEEAMQTQQLARRLSATGARLSSEVRQQVRRLQAVTDEKTELSEELRVLQDNHALLRSNFQVLQEMGPSPSTGSSALASVSALSPHLPRTGPCGSPGGLVLSSRQRALLEGLSVTAQESASLRQHGFFVEVLSLTPSDVALASSAPPASSSVGLALAGGGGAAEAAGVGELQTAWELAVRRVYEQHTRLLQAQIQAAEAKALELNLAVRDSLDRLRREEEAKQSLRDEAAGVKAKLRGVQDDMESTRKNYDNQLAMLTEHICTLSAKLSDKDSNLAGFHSQKVLCGRCGMWNNMGKLLAKESTGACQTCKEKVLSSG